MPSGDAVPREKTNGALMSNRVTDSTETEEHPHPTDTVPDTSGVVSLCQRREPKRKLWFIVNQ